MHYRHHRHYKHHHHRKHHKDFDSDDIVKGGEITMTEAQEKQVIALEAKDEAGTITDVEKELLLKLLELDEADEDVALANQAVTTAQAAVDQSAQKALDDAKAALATATDVQTKKVEEVATAQAAVDAATATPGEGGAGDAGNNGSQDQSGSTPTA